MGLFSHKYLFYEPKTLCISIQAFSSSFKSVKLRVKYNILLGSFISYSNIVTLFRY